MSQRSIVVVALVCSLCAGRFVAAQPTESGRDLDRMVGRSATGLALPNAPIDAPLDLVADRANHWREGDTEVLLLVGNVEAAIGDYFFQADSAAAFIRNRKINGVDSREVALYLEHVKSIGGSRVSADAPRLLVTAVLRGPVRLKAVLKNEDASAHPLVSAGRARVARYHDALAAQFVPVPDGPPLLGPDQLARRDATTDLIEGQRRAAAEAHRDRLAQPGDSTAGLAPSKQDARVSFRAEKLVVDRNEEGTEGHVLIMGDISIMFAEPRTNRIVSLQADNAVIFLDPEATDEANAQSIGVQNVRGVYLEGNVSATDGDYTFRGQRVFYDPKNDKAVVLDAVMYAWDPKRKVPLYFRADTLRQQSANQWSATDARFTTSEFAEPHFSIGVGRLTLTRTEGQTGGATQMSAFHVEADDVTLNAGKLPFFYWPGVSGDAGSIPLQSASVGHSSRRGATLNTRWDLFALMDRTAPEGIDASLLVDGYSERGPALGLETDYDVASAFGELETYYLFDHGTDEPGGREPVDPEHENRGKFLWRHRHELPDDWEATVELAWLSDPNFLEEFYAGDAMSDKGYESLLYLKKQRDDWAFTFLASHDFLDFVPTTDTLQGRGNIGPPAIGYTVEKLPEIGYDRIATPLWDNRLTLYSQNSASAMRINFPTDTPRERGFTPSETAAVFGFFTLPDPLLSNRVRFDDVLASRGYSDDTVLRADTRQEIQAPLKIGNFDITPYAIGRATAYDHDFSAYGHDDDNMRLWGGGGTRLHTEFSKIYPDAESTLFDVHQLRHIVEPSANLFYADTSILQEDLPVYDYDVESLAEGGQLRMGVRNTLQTQRGGEGHSRSVDWLRIDNDVVLNTDETVRESPIARFFDSRPENNLVGDHLWNQVAWQTTEALSFVADANYSLETDEIARWTAGIRFDHSPVLTSFVQYRDLNALGVPGSKILRDATYVRYGFEYLLTPKYQIGLAHSYDLEYNRDRDLTLSVTRRLPRWLLIATFDLDRIEGTTSAGIAMVPEGFSGRGSPNQNPFLFDRN